MDPSIAALYEQPIGEKEEAPWEQERLNLQRAVILGAPGGGKTFLTQTTALALAKQGLEEREKRSTPLNQLPLPIRVDLNDLASESGSDDLLDILAPLVSKNYKLPALEPWLRGNLKADNCWLILDALDQVDSNRLVGLARRLESIRDWKCHALITCRKANYNRADIPWTTITEYELAPFDATEIAALITRWHEKKDGRGEKLNEVVGRSYSLQQGCGTPLMLTLACLANEEEALTEETRRVDLYWMVLRGILRNAWREPRLGPKDPRIDDLLRMLRPMAWKLFLGSPSVNQFPSSRVVEAIEVGANAAKLPDPVPVLRDELVERGVLVDAGVIRGEGQFSFLHRSFQEFLVADCLSRIANAQDWDKARVEMKPGGLISLLALLDKKSWLPEWQEVIILLAGILKEPTPLLEMLRTPKRDDIFRHRLTLAALCMGELSSAKGCESTINEITAQVWACHLETVKEGTREVSQPIAQTLPALARLDGELHPRVRLLDYTTSLLRDPKDAIFRWSIFSPPPWIMPLIIFYRTYGYPDMHVRVEAAEALGRMGSAAARSEIVKQLAFLLDFSQAEPVDYATRIRVGDPARTVAASAAEALGRIGWSAASAEVVSQLLGCLKYANDTHLQFKVAQALGRLGPLAQRPEVIELLFEGLRDNEWVVRNGAAEALGRVTEMAPRMVLDRLVQYLRDPEVNVRTGAADALARMGSLAPRPDIIESLANCLRDPDEDLRDKAVQALGQMGPAAGTEVVDLLVQSLRDPSGYVRMRAVNGLGRLRSRTSHVNMVELMLESLADSEDFVRSSAAEVLGLLAPAAAHAEAVRRLFTCLRDSGANVRSEAARALGRFGAVAGVALLKQLVEFSREPDQNLRQSAIEALGWVGASGGSDVVDRLLEALRDSETGVRWSAIEALGRVGPVAARTQVVNRLMECLREPGLRAEAAAALGQMGAAAVRRDVVTKLMEYRRAGGNDRTKATKALVRLMNTGARFFRSWRGVTISWVNDLSR
jgi:HEAT repeat protein